MSSPLLLSAIWVVPLLAAFATLFLKRDDHLAVKLVHAVCHGGNLLLAISLLVSFLAETEGALPAAGTVTQLHFAMDRIWIPALNIHYNVGVDGLSMLMILLTAMIIFAGVFASWGIRDRAREFFILLDLLVAGVYGTFMSFDLFALFLFYEVAVLPMYLLIGVWGTGRKEYSAMKLTLMLVAGSALLMGGILALYFGSHLQTFDLNVLSQYPFPRSFQRLFFPILFFGFGVLSAIFPFHTWSPDGHASAPTAVSMLHAGVLMKLGGYGILRVAMYVLPEGAMEWFPWLILPIAVNVAYGPFVALRQRDLKYITAYSSVSHLGLVLLGLAVCTFTGIKGSAMQMISHGLLTGLFFALIGMIYGRTHTRNVDEMGGLMKRMPFLGVSFVLAGFAGLGLPGLSGFVAESTIFLGAFENPSAVVRGCTVVAILSIVTTAVYILRAANRMLHGPLPERFEPLTDAVWNERLAVIVLLVGLFGMGLFPGWIADALDGSVAPLFNNLVRAVVP